MVQKTSLNPLDPLIHNPSGSPHPRGFARGTRERDIRIYDLRLVDGSVEVEAPEPALLVVLLGIQILQLIVKGENHRPEGFLLAKAHRGSNTGPHRSFNVTQNLRILCVLGGDLLQRALAESDNRLKHHFFILLADGQLHKIPDLVPENRLQQKSVSPFDAN
eukprot:CAMPEP_0184303124 /NCGR_PEP_ID=MMETSP1049-20130417/12927_1 /TAXON_ID=77928 /ORGANISM="Proteomonas sulcata, Strain CCMP704" /LENGTH=161 /DNA_ID=CAMNT_0026614565 /DNA_START=316 /DNA_END=801 /DNA_ORIENTATION=-